MVGGHCKQPAPVDATSGRRAYADTRMRVCGDTATTEGGRDGGRAWWRSRLGLRRHQRRGAWTTVPAARRGSAA